jgi:hypothetical protein
MEAANTFETSVNFYQTTWCFNPQDSHLHTRYSVNVKSYMKELVYTQRNNDRNAQLQRILDAAETSETIIHS